MTSALNFALSHKIGDGFLERFRPNIFREADPDRLALQRVSLFTGKLKSEDTEFRWIKHTPVNWGKDHGWKLLLWNDAQIISDMELRGGRVRFTATVASRLNNLTQNWDGEIHYLRGGPELDKDGKEIPIIDLNRDGKFDDRDRGTVHYPVVIRRNNGLRSGPTSVRFGNGIDGIIHNGQLLRGSVRDLIWGEVRPAPFSCDDCPGGLKYGRLYVAGYKKGNFDGEADITNAQHDDTFNTNYIDITQSRTLTGTNGPMLEGDTEYGKRYMVLVENADLSPDAIIRINKVNYNALEYQTMLHKKLDLISTWNGTWGIKDKDGNTLTFSAEELDCKDCLRVTFPRDAMTRGGLMPTHSQCVVDSDDWNRDSINNERHRGGALQVTIIELKYGRLLECAAAAVDNVVDSITDRLEDRNGLLGLRGGGDGLVSRFGGMSIADNLSSEQRQRVVYSTSIFWEWDNIHSCYQDQQYNRDYATLLKSAYHCTGDFDTETCEPRTSGIPAVDNLVESLQDKNIAAGSLVSAWNNTKKWCKANREVSIDYARTCTLGASLLSGLEQPFRTLFPNLGDGRGLFNGPQGIT